MSIELHYRKQDDKYALWSTVIDDYITDFDSKEIIRNKWYLRKFESAMQDVDKWMEEIDEEV